MTASDSESALNLFLRSFSAADLADSLPSFDESTNRESILAAMDSQRLDVVGVRRNGHIATWLTRHDLASCEEGHSERSFTADSLIESTTGLHDVVTALSNSPQLFVRSFGQVGGLIRLCDLQKPAMRMWLFGLITVTEIRVTRLIDERFPEESWQTCLSSGRLQKARALQHERLRWNERRSLLECLNFIDKGTIVARDERLRQLTRFSSRRQVEDFASDLQTLRNNLAHSHGIVGDWSVILELARNLHRIVLGPDSVSESIAPPLG